MWFVSLTAVLICVVRFFMEPTHVSFGGTYQAIAHLFVGGLIGAAISTRNRRKEMILLAVVMSVVEIIAAIVTRLA